MSRKERKKQDVQKKANSANSDISRLYYIVIGLLFVILIGLVIFIFSRSGNDVDLNDENDNGTEQVEPSEPDNDSSEAEEPDTDHSDGTETPPIEGEGNDDESADEPNQEVEDEAADENQTDAEDNENPEMSDTDVGETVTVNNDAPHDPSHAVDYAAGSVDRIAIKNRVMEVTGLDSSLIEWWIGNDGPGRVKATVSNIESTIYFDVYLQYGEGSWHVTRYQRVSGN